MDQELLYDVLKRHIQKSGSSLAALDMGHYNAAPLVSAANGRGLFALISLSTALMEVSPNMVIPYIQLKSLGALSATCACLFLLDEAWEGISWAGRVATKLKAAEVCRRQATAKLPRRVPCAVAAQRPPWAGAFGDESQGGAQSLAKDCHVTSQVRSQSHQK